MYILGWSVPFSQNHQNLNIYIFDRPKWNGEKRRYFTNLGMHLLILLSGLAEPAAAPFAGKSCTPGLFWNIQSEADKVIYHGKIERRRRRWKSVVLFLYHISWEREKNITEPRTPLLKKVSILPFESQLRFSFFHEGLWLYFEYDTNYLYNVR